MAELRCGVPPTVNDLRPHARQQRCRDGLDDGYACALGGLPVHLVEVPALVTDREP
jgi:hypothetical protein